MAKLLYSMSWRAGVRGPPALPCVPVCPRVPGSVREFSESLNTDHMNSRLIVGGALRVLAPAFGGRGAPRARARAASSKQIAPAPPPPFLRRLAVMASARGKKFAARLRRSCCRRPFLSPSGCEPCLLVRACLLKTTWTSPPLCVGRRWWEESDEVLPQSGHRSLCRRHRGGQPADAD